MGRTPDRRHRAIQQRVEATFATNSKGAYLAQPSKEEIRAATPLYNEAMVKRIPSGVTSKRKLPKNAEPTK